MWTPQSRGLAKLDQTPKHTNRGSLALHQTRGLRDVVGGWVRQELVQRLNRPHAGRDSCGEEAHKRHLLTCGGVLELRVGIAGA